jgi:hypothetical protein
VNVGFGFNFQRETLAVPTSKRFAPSSMQFFFFHYCKEFSSKFFWVGHGDCNRIYKSSIISSSYAALAILAYAFFL